MTPTIPHSMSQLTLHKLHRLAEQRSAYFAELRDSGRWKHYFSEAEIDAKVKESAGFTEYWRKAVEAARIGDATVNALPPVSLPLSLSSMSVPPLPPRLPPVQLAKAG